MNCAKGEILILTASDQIKGIEQLTKELSDVMFHIPANTQVSDKIHRLAEQENVKIYPQISQKDLDALWDACDFYLDINYYREIYNAIDAAHQNNLLIMGFEDTLHKRELVEEACIFSRDDCEKLVSALKMLIGNPVFVQDLLEKQQNKRSNILKKMQELWGGI